MGGSEVSQAWQSDGVSVLRVASCLPQLSLNQYRLLPAETSHTPKCVYRAQKPGHRGSFLHALRIRLLKYKMETESESSTSGDDSVFCLDSEVMMDSEEGEMEDNFR